jgi:hypothetical protein
VADGNVGQLHLGGAAAPAFQAPYECRASRPAAWFPLESEGRHSHAIANRERARINSDTMIVMLSASARHAVALVIAREKREIQ